MEQIFEMMVDKLEVYADQNTFKLFRDKFLPFLIDSTINILHSFYVEVSRNCTTEEYQTYHFRETAQWREAISSIVKERLSDTSETPESPQIAPTDTGRV